MIPSQFRNIYPNPVQDVAGTPAVVFRDHRWTLPALHFAGETGLLRLPARVVTFDRHRDSLTPCSENGDPARFPKRPEGGELVETVARRLSPRDDDWIIAGMELGLISDVVQFRTEPDGMAEITRHIDGAEVAHRIFHRERLSMELAWKGALVDETHDAAVEGLWDALGWNPSAMTATPSDDLALDIDLDFFTVSWENYTFPFPAEVYEGEFLAPRPSGCHPGYRPVDFLGSLIEASRLLTIACEPDFCGGAVKTRTILEDVNRFLLEGALDAPAIQVDYQTVYPVE